MMAMPGRLLTGIGRAVRWFLTDPARAIGKCWAWYRWVGLSGCWARAVRKFAGGPQRRLAPPLTPERAAEVLAGCGRQPLISIVTPVYKVAPRWLEECIASVAGQYYRNWELLLVDDGSERPDLTGLMEAWAARDGRIRLRRMERNSGIAAASNAGIEMARGEYVGFLDHDDELTPDALTWVVEAIDRHPGAKWLYSDEDKISAKGTRYDPYCKSGYNPYMLLSIMYTAHLSIYRAESLKRLGGFRAGFEGAQDHDLALRVSELVPREEVAHIPRVLYHWRSIQGSTAAPGEAKPYAAVAGRRAVEEALNRRGIKGTVTSHSLLPTLYRVELSPRDHPPVTVIIPTRNASGLVTRCIAALRAHTCYPAYRVLVIDNRSDEPALLRYLAEESAAGRLLVMKYDKPFNHSDMNNLAVRSVDSELVVLMNNDVEIVSDGWLEQMVATLQLDGSVAGAGALLLFPNRTVQHSGVIIGVNQAAGHAHRGVAVSQGGYFGRLHSLQEYSALTAAMVLFRRAAFLEVGGFNPERYPTSFNDIDLCLRLRERGYRLVYNPAVQALHREGGSRKIEMPEESEFVRRFAADWGHRFGRDPFYNPNLTLQNEQFDGFRDYTVEERPGTTDRS